MDHPRVPMMVARPGRPVRELLGLVVAAAEAMAVLSGAGACGAQASRAQCATDAQCGTANAAACLMGTCVPRGTGRMFAIELSPRLDSTSAQTELVNIALGSDPVTLAAEDAVTISGSAVDSEGNVYATDGHLMAFTASVIPGRSDLEIDTDMAGLAFDLAVRQSLVGANATVWISPTPKALTQPPVRFSTVLEDMMTLNFPTAAELLRVTGVLLDPLGDPLVGFVARAHAGATGDVVSNAVATDAAGHFELKIAPGTIAAADSSGIVVDLAPPASGYTGWPHFVSQPMALASAAGDPLSATSTTGTTGGTGTMPVFHMPAFGTPAPLVFTVRAGDGSMRLLSDVTVKFRTEIPAPPEGSALYESESSTNVNGEVQVSLIPGTADKARLYQVTALPLPDSPYALKCLAQLSVAGVGSGSQSQYSVTMLLDRKVTLQGTIVGGDGSAASGISVTATPISSTSDCVDAQSLGPASTTTTPSGGYSLLLNPGVYRVDVEPPVGAPYPRLTLDGPSALTLTANLSRDIVLPRGEVVEGNVEASDQTALASATLRFFEVLCDGDTCLGDNRVAPALRGQTRTDTAGHFRAVLPVSAAMTP